MARDFTPRPDADRLKAWELFLSATTGGKYRSLRSIASELGVSSVTITRWKEVDKWDDRIKTLLVTTGNTAESTSQAVKRRVRFGLLDGIEELHAMVKDTSISAKDRIEAVKAIASIAAKIDALTAGTFGGDAAAGPVPEFNDTLETPWQTSIGEKESPQGETPSVSGDSERSPSQLSLPLSPTPENPSSSSSEADSESLPEESLPEEGGEQ